eukprot:1388735-Pleurochrysis_carterae.AAC.1
MIENPADCGDTAGMAWWPRFEDHAPLWLMPKMRRAAMTTGAGMLTLTQCASGAPVRMYTTLAYAPGMHAHVGELTAAVCSHEEEQHTHRAHGRDGEGRARASAAAAYPHAMNVAVAKAILAATGCTPTPSSENE